MSIRETCPLSLYCLIIITWDWVEFMNWIWVYLIKFLNKGEDFFLIWSSLTKRHLLVKTVWKTMQNEPDCSPITEILAQESDQCRWLITSVQHNPCLGPGCQERRIYYAMRCSRTNSRDRCGKDRTENTWWEYPSYSSRDLSNIQLSETEGFYNFFSLSVSETSVMLLELMLPNLNA